MRFVEDEEGGVSSLDVSEFHWGLVLSSGMESYRDVLGSVLVDEEDAT
jgi:hypothetical protein